MKRSILIVEDVPDMLQLLQQMVSGIPGFTVSGLAKNTWEARLELARRRPDLVLLDEILPGESSGDLLREINQAGIPVVLLTGMENPGHPFPVGATLRLTKPGWDSLAADQARFQKEIEAVLK